MFKGLLLGALLVVGIVGQANAAPILYNNDKAGFDAATNSLTFEDFESTTINSSTEIGFNGGDFTCNGGSYCPGFFGISTIFSLSGNRSVYFATPDSATFSFDTAINSFGIVMAGQGDISPIDLYLTTSSGDTLQVLDDFVGPLGLVNFDYFFGITDGTSTFTSVTISGNKQRDGIFFDNLEFGLADIATVPEPASFALLCLGLAGIGFSRRKQPV